MAGIAFPMDRIFSQTVSGRPKSEVLAQLAAEHPQAGAFHFVEDKFSTLEKVNTGWVSVLGLAGKTGLGPSNLLRHRCRKQGGKGLSILHERCLLQKREGRDGYLQMDPPATMQAHSRLQSHPIPAADRAAWHQERR